MITNLTEYIKEMYTNMDTGNGPSIQAGGDPTIGSLGGTNGGKIGGADVGGGMDMNDDVSSRGANTRAYKQNVGYIKYKESQKRKKAIKDLEDLDKVIAEIDTSGK